MSKFILERNNISPYRSAKTGGKYVWYTEWLEKVHAQAHTACFSLKPWDWSEAFTFDPPPAGNSSWCCLPKAHTWLWALRSFPSCYTAALAPVFDKPQHSHWLWFPEAGCLAVRWQMLTHTASDTDCKHVCTPANQIYRTKRHSSVI